LIALVEQIVVEGPTGDKCTIKCKLDEQALLPEMMCLIECETKDFGYAPMGEFSVSPVLIDIVRRTRTLGGCKEVEQSEIGKEYKEYRALLRPRHT